VSSTLYGSVPLHLVPAPIEVVLSLKNTTAIESQHAEIIGNRMSEQQHENLDGESQGEDRSAAKAFRAAIVVEVES